MFVWKTTACILILTVVNCCMLNGHRIIEKYAEISKSTHSIALLQFFSNFYVLFYRYHTGGCRGAGRVISLIFWLCSSVCSPVCQLPFEPQRCRLWRSLDISRPTCLTGIVWGLFIGRALQICASSSSSSLVECDHIVQQKAEKRTWKSMLATHIRKPAQIVISCDPNSIELGYGKIWNLELWRHQ